MSETTMNQVRITYGRPALALPADETVTQTFGILAKRGAGKTYTAAVMVEELLKASHQVIVVDPLGVWFGLRSSPDGKTAGLPIVILGGDHGDVPLEETGGEVAADLAIDGVSMILDLSHFRKNQARRFMLAFAERLYHRKKQAQAPLHLVLDEADLFVPQSRGGGRQKGDEAPLVGAIEDLVRRGRAKGLGVTLITQRSAVIAKDVLTQIDTLIVLRTTGPQDRKAIEAWVNVHGDEEGWKTMLGSLAALPIGTAWVWSPGWLAVLEKVQIRERETFDSSATPKAGTKPRTPKRLADVDLAAVQEQMAATIERAKAEDPKELHKQIRELKRQVRERPTETEVEEVVRQVPVFDAERLDVVRKAIAEGLGTVAGHLGRMAEDLEKRTEGWFEKATAPLMELEEDIQTLVKEVEQAPDPRALPVSAPQVRSQNRKSQPDPMRERARTTTPGSDDSTLSSSQQRILDALAWLENVGIAAARRPAVAFLADTRPTSGGFKNNLGALRSAGLIDYPTKGRGRSDGRRTDARRPAAGADGSPGPPPPGPRPRDGLAGRAPGGSDR